MSSMEPKAVGFLDFAIVRKIKEETEIVVLLQLFKEKSRSVFPF
ncbi:hypothetical protein OIU76_029539, partial [Salix suchowensis]